MLMPLSNCSWPRRRTWQHSECWRLGSPRSAATRAPKFESSLHKQFTSKRPNYKIQKLVMQTEDTSCWPYVLVWHQMVHNIWPWNLQVIALQEFGRHIQSKCLNAWHVLPLRTLLFHSSIDGLVPPGPLLLLPNPVKLKSPGSLLKTGGSGEELGKTPRSDQPGPSYWTDEQPSHENTRFVVDAFGEISGFPWHGSHRRWQLTTDSSILKPPTCWKDMEVIFNQLASISSVVKNSGRTQVISLNQLPKLAWAICHKGFSDATVNGHVILGCHCHKRKALPQWISAKN